MKTSDKAKNVISAIENVVGSLRRAYTTAAINNAKEEAAHEMYNQLDAERDNIGFSQNPYRPENSKLKLIEASSVLDEWNLTYEYAVRVFFDSLPEEEK